LLLVLATVFTSTVNIPGNSILTVVYYRIFLIVYRYLVLLFCSL